MKLLKGFGIAMIAAGLTAPSHAQLMGFFNTGQNTKVIKDEDDVMQKQDLSWTVVSDNKHVGFTRLGWVVAPFDDPPNKATFVTPPANVHWISGFMPVKGWMGQPLSLTSFATYTYTTKFTVGKLGATDFAGQYASFENVTSLKLNGNNPTAGGSNTFTNDPASKAGNCFNSWTKFSFGNLNAGQYTLIATVDDNTIPTGLPYKFVGLTLQANPNGFVLQASATTPTGIGPEPVPEPASLIALPLGLLLLRRHRRKA